MSTNSQPMNSFSRAAFNRDVTPVLPASMLQEATVSPYRRGASHDKQAGRDEALRPSSPNATGAAVEIFPSNAVSRRAVTWNGMTAEIVQATTRNKIELHFRAPVHLLVVCERGIRRNGETFVEGLPRSALRDQTRKLTFVPAGHDYFEWQATPPFHPPLSFSLAPRPP